MLSLYPSQSYPLEVLCSHYLETGKHFWCFLLKPAANSGAFLAVKVVSVTLNVYNNILYFFVVAF